MPDLVLTDFAHDGRLAVVSMNRPDQRNASSIAVLDAMDESLDEIADEGTVEAIVLAGVGRSFCAGIDLAEVRSDRETITRLLTRLGEVMRRLRRQDAVTVAAVQGAAIGGGFGFMCVCDFAVTHTGAKIGYPPVTTGLSPALMAPWLIRKLGPSGARAMMLAGGSIDGEEAHRRGLATHLVAEDAVTATAHDLAEAALTAPAGALRALKTLLNDLDGSSVGDDVLTRSAMVSADVMASDATQAALERLLSGS